MKKNLLLLGAMLVATLSLTNCTKEIEGPQTSQDAEALPYTIYANIAQTKTVNNGLSTEWAEGDALTVFVANAGTSDYSENTEFSLVDAATGEFYGEINSMLHSSNDWYVFYPYTKFIDTPKNIDSGYTTVGSRANNSQTQNGNNSMAHIAGANYPMIGVSMDAKDAQLPSITMNHVSSLIEVEVTNVASTEIAVSNITLTAPEAVIGTFYIDFSTETPAFVASGENYVSNTASLTVKNGEKIPVKETAKFYLAVKPFTLSAGQTLALSVNGNKKEIIAEKDVVFAPGKIKTLTIPVETALTPITISEVIAAEKSTPVLTEGLVIGTYAKGFIIEDKTGKILVYENATPSATVGDIVSVEGTRAEYGGLAQIGSPSVKVLSSDNTVTYPNPKVLDGAGMDEMLSTTSLEYIQYIGSLKVSGSYYNVTVDGATTAIGSVSYPLESLGLADMNGKYIIVTGYYVGTTGSKYVNTMAMNVELAPELEPVKATIAEVLAAPVSGRYWYEVTGLITEVTNANTGQLTIEDETGSIAVYKLKPTKDGDAKDFPNLKLRAGDTVTLIGNRGAHDDNPAMANSYYVSHIVGEHDPVVTFDAANLAFEATGATAKTVTYTMDPEDATGVTFELSGTNADKFTLSVDGTSLTVTPVGDNTSEAAYTASLDAIYKENVIASVEITQAKPSAEGTATVTISLSGGSGKNQDPITFESAPIKIEFTSGTHTTKPRWDAGLVRFYGTNDKSNLLTISGATITEIEFGMNGTYTLEKMTASVGAISGTTWTGSSDTIEFTATAQTRIETITVTYIK